MNKGTVVLVTKSVYTKEPVGKQLHVGEIEKLRDIKIGKEDWSQYARNFIRITHDKPFLALVVGRSVRISGHYYPGGSSYGMEGTEYEAGEIRNTKTHKVIMVQPLDKQQWFRPIPCLEADLEILEIFKYGDVNA